MKKQFDLVVFIGRLEPLHFGHCDVLDHAYELSDTVLCLLGSANRPRSARNPWTALERELMVLTVYPSMLVGYLNDYLYNDCSWVSQVNYEIETALICAGITDPSTAKVALVGHNKDSTSYYLTMFPHLTLVDVEPTRLLHATDIRTILFREEYQGKWEKLATMVPPKVLELLREKSESGALEPLRGEHLTIRQQAEYKANYPYPINDVTVDAVVYHPSGKVLVIKRAGMVGNGLLALPGGYLDPEERIIDGCVRELMEETNISVLPHLMSDLDNISAAEISKDMLKQQVKAVKVFDHPQRSQLGRIITHAHLIVLETPYLPTVSGGDDASHAFWIDVAEVSDNAQLFHDDHADIITFMLKYV